MPGYLIPLTKKNIHSPHHTTPRRAINFEQVLPSFILYKYQVSQLMTKILDDETDCGLLYSVLLCRLTTPIMSDNRGICLMTFFRIFFFLNFIAPLCI